MAFREEIEGTNEYIDFQKYTGNRQFVFNDTKIDFCITQNEQNPIFSEIASNAVKTWHDRIVEVTENSEVWNMTTHVFPKDDSICDGYINFYDTPVPTSFQLLGVTGYSHPQTPIANVTIYTDNYPSTLSELAKENENFWPSMTIEKLQDIIKNGDHKQFDNKMIQRVTLHEIGHSLSLNHPKSINGNLEDAAGIMGYNLSYNQIDDAEVLNIVKAYPNGFSSSSKSESIKITENNSKKILRLGEVTNLTIEIPNQEGKLPPIGIELYIFPNGAVSQKTDTAPIKIVRTEGKTQLENSGEYFTDIQSALIHWGSTKTLSVQLKAIKEIETADIIVIAQRVGGFEESWFLEDVISVKEALFSNLLLNFETTKHKYFLKGSNPNRLLETEYVLQNKQEQLYNEALVDCLSKKNMKKCADLIKFEDFKIDSLNFSKSFS
ncbi:MAG: hypothetical protein PVI88_02520 [Nitrosopumilaceae archaeon]